MGVGVELCECPLQQREKKSQHDSRQLAASKDPPPTAAVINMAGRIGSAAKTTIAAIRAAAITVTFNNVAMKAEPCTTVEGPAF